MYKISTYEYIGYILLFNLNINSRNHNFTPLPFITLNSLCGFSDVKTQKNFHVFCTFSILNKFDPSLICKIIIEMGRHTNFIKYYFSLYFILFLLRDTYFIMYKKNKDHTYSLLFTLKNLEKERPLFSNGNFCFP